MLLSGFYLKDEDIPAWISWFRYLVFLRFSFHSVVQCEFPSNRFFGTGAGLLSNEYILRNLAAVPQTPPMWSDALIAFGLGCFYRLVAFFNLKYLNRGLGVEA